jgi:hypothetical protein
VSTLAQRLGCPQPGQREAHDGDGFHASDVSRPPRGGTA